MELDSFLASPRWEILQIITQKPSSPIEISEKTKTTTSFVSQQLKLLEAAGVVKKERTGAVEKGKPRTLFSIQKESLYLVPLAKNFTEKKFIPLSREHKVILKIWSLEDTRIQPMLERLFWIIQPSLEKIELIVVYLKSILPKVYILSKESSLSQKIDKSQKDLEEKVPVEIISSTSPIFKLDSENTIILYDPEQLLEDANSLKGGNEEKDE